jgi:hypothetical protein
MNLRNIVINTSLAVSGVALWSYGAARLASGGDFEYRPNPLGLKMSPYGQVIALAVQGGIDSDWHGAERRMPGETCGSCGQDHGADESTCPPRGNPASPGPSFIARIEDAVNERTNPRPATGGHKFYLRRQVEDRLRFAYELDPSNYANYNSYHLFLTEPAVGTRPVMSHKVLELARTTIEYCLREQNDPRPALTAAAASCNILQLMFMDPELYSIEEMRQHLQVLDYGLARHHELSAAWLESGEFENLSPARVNEMLERLTFCTKIRETADKTICRLRSTDQASISR